MSHKNVFARPGRPVPMNDVAISRSRRARANEERLNGLYRRDKPMPGSSPRTARRLQRTK